MITATALEKRFGEKEVLRGLDVDLPRGGFLLVTGRNGSGKSTLLRLFAGLLAPTGGELTVAADRRQIGYLGHEPLVYRQLTALENLELSEDELAEIDRYALESGIDLWAESSAG